jgi:hypothetical protein
MLWEQVLGRGKKEHAEKYIGRMIDRGIRLWMGSGKKKKYQGRKRT